MNYQLLAIFGTVAREESFTGAARKLGIGKGTVSRAITALEAQLGTELVHRTTHAVALSTAGIELYERTATHLAALDSAVHKLPERTAEPSGVLRLTVPNDFALVVLPRLISQFARRHPQVQFDIRITNEVLDLVAEGFDVAIRAVSKLKDSTLTIRRLGVGTSGWYAAPEYVTRRGKPKAIGDPRHEWIVVTAMKPWLALPKDAPTRFRCDDLLLARSLAREGAGICFLPSFTAAPFVREGWLEPLGLPDLMRARKADLAVLYPSSGQVPRKVTAFRDFVLEWAKTARGA